MNQELIERLRKGEIAVKNDGTLDELKRVLKEAFLEDKSTVLGNGNYYQANMCSNKYWMSSNLRTTLSYSIKDFLAPEFEWGEEIEVRDDGGYWIKGKFVGMNPYKGCDYKYAVSTYLNSVFHAYKKARKIKKEMDIRLTLNGKEISPKDISEETWKKLRG